MEKEQKYGFKTISIEILIAKIVVFSLSILYIVLKLARARGDTGSAFDFNYYCDYLQLYSNKNSIGKTYLH